MRRFVLGLFRDICFWILFCVVFVSLLLGWKKQKNRFHTFICFANKNMLALQAGLCWTKLESTRSVKVCRKTQQTSVILFRLCMVPCGALSLLDGGFSFKTRCIKSHCVEASFWNAQHCFLEVVQERKKVCTIVFLLVKWLHFGTFVSAHCCFQSSANWTACRLLKKNSLGEWASRHFHPE